jgi:hypothetical protein
MRWEKLGLVFAPRHGSEWMRSHAAAPAPLMLSESLCRVFFASRDADNRSHVGYFDVNLDHPTQVLNVSENPVLAPGPLGYFDDHGVYASSAVMNEDKVFLYTIGWNPGSKQPLFYSSIGLAISQDGGKTFAKHGRSPIMARSDHDPCLVTAPVAIKDRGKWRMWYVSGTGWSNEDGSLHSRYHIKYAESVDGIVWKRDGIVCLDNPDRLERNIGRTCVLRLNDGWHAWFCSDRGAGYRIGHARSFDGLVWERDSTPPGLEPSSAGWDSEAMAYPYVVAYKTKLFMFYNGNKFGREGVGLAVCDRSE